MTRRYTEAGLVERPSLALLEQLGWTVVSGFQEIFGPGGTLGRDSMHDVVLTHRLRDALRDLNPRIPDTIREEALTTIARDRSLMDGVRANREVYNLICDGYRAEWTDEHGERQYATVQYVDFHDSTKNEWVAVPQMWFAGDLYRRRTDTVLFVNGIPLVLFEFKDPNRPVKAATTRTSPTTATRFHSFSCQTHLSFSPTDETRRLALPTRRGTSLVTGLLSTPRATAALLPWRLRSEAPALRTCCST